MVLCVVLEVVWSLSLWEPEAVRLYLDEKREGVYTDVKDILDLLYSRFSSHFECSIV